MKKIITTLISSIMFFSSFSQNIVYDKTGSKKTFESEDIEIEFKPSEVRFPDKPGEEAAGLIALLPTLVDIGFQLTTNAIEKNAKKYTAEYSKQKSYLEAASLKVPDFKFIRKIKLEDWEPALEISFKAVSVEDMQAFIYYIDKIELNYSSAKAKSKNNTFDYSFEIKPTILLSTGEKKTLELSPLAISSVGFEDAKPFPEKKHRTDIIPLPKGAVLTEMSVKIIETNPIKVRAEKILSLWNDNKDNVKTIINQYLPKEDEEGDSKDENSDGGSGNEDSNVDESASTGNG